MKSILIHWFPRLIVIGFAVSIPFSAPEFITGMDEGEFIVWLLRLIWVFVFPVTLCLILVMTHLVRKFKRSPK